MSVTAIIKGKFVSYAGRQALRALAFCYCNYLSIVFVAPVFMLRAALGKLLLVRIRVVHCLACKHTILAWSTSLILIIIYR